MRFFYKNKIISNWLKPNLVKFKWICYCISIRLVFIFVLERYNFGIGIFAGIRGHKYRHYKLWNFKRLFWLLILKLFGHKMKRSRNLFTIQ